MKNNGFTLIELLSVLVITGIIMGISIQSYRVLTNRNNETKYEYYLESMKKSADLFLESRKDKMASGSCLSVNYQTLVTKGLLKEENITCTGYLQLKKNGRKYTYDVTALECKNEKGTVLKEKTANVNASCTVVN